MTHGRPPRHRRTARAFTLGAGGTAAFALHVLDEHLVLAVFALYVAAVLAWSAVAYRAAHHRQTDEADWEQRHVHGKRPAPLIPCCLLADYSGGAAHDRRRCTNVAHRLPTARSST
ncbi:hypothetical protein JHN52_01175 [Streptomyces sp. MBT97]|uniref:hypothetical protein n=1 Tax=Streptomyces sp. MBT97 TaxID=2800411 RepID=UPI00190A17FD|nr:hypothetical protein [Streptomyces sp. MBT97]MBK3631592.1 hypothetical protein [Streptomyces sp. MBT97]